MKIREFINIQEKIIDQIPKKFSKISEIVKDCVRFNGTELIKHPMIYQDVFRYKNYKCSLEETNNNYIYITWIDDWEDVCNVLVSENFFDNFEEYLNEVREYVRKNNEVETEKYNKYLENHKQNIKAKETKEYQEYLRLKAKFEK